MSVDYSKRFNLPDVYKYDSVNTFTLTFKESDDTTLIDMTGSSVVMTFSLWGKKYRELTVWDGISISNSLVTIAIPPFTKEGKYSYDVQVEKDGIKRTYIYWEILVHNDVSRW